jgi:hypothetical protein
MSTREERLPTRGTFCKHCGKPATMCSCAARDMRNLDAWDDKQPDPKAMRKAEPADARTVKPGHPVGYHEVAPAKAKPKMDFKVEVVEPDRFTAPVAGDDESWSVDDDEPQQIQEPAPQFSPSSERDIDKALSGIHALASHLLGVVPGFDAHVHVEIAPVKPGEFKVAVVYNGFAMVKHAPTLADALHEMLADLTDRVARHAIASDELLEKLGQ